MKRSSILFALFLTVQLAAAQQMTWGKAIEGLPATPWYAAATPTPEGGLIVCGYFYVSSYDRPFLARYAPDGNAEWVRVFESSSSFYMEDVALRKDGTIAVGGWAGPDSDIDPGPAVKFVPLPASGNYHAYLASFTAAGDFVRVDTFGQGKVKALDIDKDGNLYLLGNMTFNSAWDMDLGSGKYLAVPDEQSGSELVAAKYSPAGQLIWASQTTGMGNPGQGSSIGSLFLGLDHLGHLYAAGQFDASSASISFPSTGNAVILTGNRMDHGSDIYLAKFNASDGKALWVRAIGGLQNNPLRAMDVGLDGKVALAGGYLDSTRLDGAPGIVLAPWNPASQIDDPFFAVYEPSGTVLRAAGLPAGKNESFFGAAFNSVGELWLAARIGTDPIDFDPGPGTHIVQSFGIALAKYDAMAELDWVYPMGADMPLTLVPDPTGGFFLLARTSANGADFDVTPRIRKVGSASSRGAVIRYRDCDITWTEAEQQLCPGDSFLLGDTVVTGPGLFKGVLPSENGCDSVVTLQVELLIIDTAVAEVAGGLQAQANGATFQWIDCADGQPIPGADEALFVPNASGEYAVIVTVSGCSDTSSCRQVTVSGIEDAGAWSGCRLWPVPARDILWLELPTLAPQPRMIRVLDALGRSVRQIDTGMGARMGIPIHGLPAGRYTLQVLGERDAVSLPFLIGADR